MTTLPDRPCRPGGVLLVGINPSPVSVEKGHYYQGSHGRRLWKRLARLKLVTNACAGSEDDAFVAGGNGLTDLVKRPTLKASELDKSELDDGVDLLRTKISEWRPRLILFPYRPPAEYLLGRANVRVGRCCDLHGIATFLLSSPYAKGDDARRADQELRALLDLGCNKALAQAPAQEPSAGKGLASTTQRITRVDLAYRRIRIPKASKRLFPGAKEYITVTIRGESMQVRYDPRDQAPERSATLGLARPIAHLVAENDILTITVESGRIVLA